VTGPVEAPAPDEDDRAFLATAREILLGLDFGPDIWPALTGALKERTGRKGKMLFLPLRRALTGLDHGPDMAQLLPLIAKEEALRRLG
jgi:glutamyl-tRNA synthetase